ncbi:hypothetical protein JCM11957_11870 [Caminibacter profundus]
MFSNFTLKLKANKIWVGEMESDIFINLNKEEYKKIEKFFLEQYMLKMEYHTPMGYVYKKNQKFNIDRKIEEDYFQHHIFDKDYETIGFFSGSTGWGWGIYKKSLMIDYFIGKNLQKNIINFSNVGSNIYKIFNIYKQFSLKDTLHEKNIFYFGINESYDISNNIDIAFSNRDRRIRKNILEFEKYYRNLPLSLKTISYLFAKSVALNILYIKHAIKKDFVKRISKKVKPIDIDKNLLNKNLGFIKNIIREINSLSDTIFILEPSLFDKENLSEYERKLILNKDLTVPNLRKSFKIVYHELINFFEKEKIKYIDARESVKVVKETIFIDYCHPWVNGTQIIGEYIAKKIKEKQWLL